MSRGLVFIGIYWLSGRFYCYSRIFLLLYFSLVYMLNKS